LFARLQRNFSSPRLGILHLAEAGYFSNSLDETAVAVGASLLLFAMLLMPSLLNSPQFGTCFFLLLIMVWLQSTNRQPFLDINLIELTKACTVDTMRWVKKLMSGVISSQVLSDLAIIIIQSN
jgi:hypothetical protein